MTVDVTSSSSLHNRASHNSRGGLFGVWSWCVWSLDVSGGLSSADEEIYKATVVVFFDRGSSISPVTLDGGSGWSNGKDGWKATCRRRAWGLDGRRLPVHVHACFYVSGGWGRWSLGCSSCCGNRLVMVSGFYGFKLEFVLECFWGWQGSSFETVNLTKYWDQGKKWRRLGESYE